MNEVEFFLARLFRGRKVSPDQLERVKERYRLVGGSSPLPGITLRQAKALEGSLHSKGYPIKAYVGMRYGHPLIEEAMKSILEDGIHEVIAVPMAPFRSHISTGAYVEEVNQVQKKMGEGMRISFLLGWYLHPLFLKAIQEKIEEGLKQFDPEDRRKVHLILTAHSLPKSLSGNETYVKDMEECVGGILKMIEPLPWHIAFQSRGIGSEEWLGPDVESILTELWQQKVREILMVPLGFVADHMEVLYDIDILYRERAASLGMTLKRTSSLNDSRQFIEALTAIVDEHMRKEFGSSELEAR